MKNYLSIVLITKNEEENISRCLKSVQFADEIILVDSGSTDQTIRIAKSYGAKIFTNKFVDFASQRNFAISKARGEWILSLDADEEIPRSLAEEIREAIKSQKVNGYLMPRKNIIFGEEIKHTRWAPDKHIWLFRKNKGKFKNSIHEEVEVTGSMGQLVNAKVHNSHKNVSEFLEMANSYTELEAGVKFYSPLRSFVGRYLLKQGFRDGWRGFVLSYLRAVYQFLAWAKQWEKS